MIGKVLVKTGIFIDPRDPKAVIKTLADANKIDADCGCGVDCCNNELVLTDKTTGDAYRLFFDGGVLRYRINGGDTFTVTVGEI